MLRRILPNDRVGQAGFLATAVIASLALLLVAYGLITAPDRIDSALVETTTRAASTAQNDWVPNAVQTFASVPAELTESTAVPLTLDAAPTVTPFATTPTAAPGPTTSASAADADDTSDDDTETTDDATDTSAEDPEPTATPEAIATPEPEATATPEPGATAEPDATAEPTPTAEATPTPTPGSPPVPRSSAFTRTLRATGDVQIAEVFDAPGGNAVGITYEYLDGTVVRNDLINPTHFGNQLAFRVLEGEPGDDWAKVSLPTRPNGQTGWINTASYDWGSSNLLVQIDVGTNRVAIFEDDELVLETQAVTGGEASPTPILSGYVDEKVFGVGGSYGPVILSLGVFSNALNTFGSGGNSPKIALHGTNQPELMGEYRSNGCIRVPNDVIEQISNLVPVGSKVEIIRT